MRVGVIFPCLMSFQIDDSLTRRKSAVSATFKTARSFIDAFVLALILCSFVLRFFMFFSCLTRSQFASRVARMQMNNIFAFHGVSKLPVLVPADKLSPADGRVMFSVGGDIPASGLPREVHLVRNSDFHNLTDRLSFEDGQFIRAARELKQAFIDDNSASARDAYAVLMPFLAELGIASDMPGLDEMAKFFTTKLNWVGRMGWPQHHYSRLVTEALSGVRVVFWWPTRKYESLAFLCPDWKSALWLAAYLDRYRICPCGKLFTPDKKKRMVACSKKHTDYFRLKRWRERKAQEKIQ